MSQLENIMPYTLYESKTQNKKYDIYVVNPASNRFKKVSFGALGYGDYTTHHDKERRERYRLRHQHDNLDDPLSPGFWSWYVLWGKSTDINKNVKSILNKLDLNY